MRARRSIPLLVLASLLGACALTPPATPVPTDMFQDALFAPATQHISATEVFELSPAMHEFIRKDLARQNFHKDPRQALVDALNSSKSLRLEYDSGTTRTASEAFAARSGNCMSLVLMTAAFAKEMGLNVHYRNVYVEPTWSRSDEFLFLSGHVNLTLGEDPKAVQGKNLMADGMTIDFLPSELIRNQRAMEIGESTIVAMYMNNRAAENLNDGRLDEAYAWVREALRQDPKYLSGYNTLGVIYRRHGNTQAAERALRYVMDNEPANTQAMSNLILVLKDQHRGQEAVQLQAKLDNLQPYPPFRYFDLGIAAMKAGDYANARDYFSKEVDRSAYYHEFHFWLALANYGLGDVKQARKQIALALENSTTTRDRDLYTAKLEWLNAQKRNTSGTFIH
ncbi:tetratricopeptide repeat protein [Pelomonas sp. KK5]|uniref:tetratricopeptide repeat protein n=1 Tax=Pelomonas sp. KK5 TaxID=1855730 RepID=UPI00097C8316|nr:tetratricopeptide repeat protein [Pelomonas sp. KK5]